MAFHWSLLTCMLSLIWTTSANTTPIQSLSPHLSKLITTHRHHPLSPPRRLQEGGFDGPFIDIVSIVEDDLELPQDPSYFYEFGAPDAYEILLNILVLRELIALREERGDSREVILFNRTDTAIAAPLIDIHSVAACIPMLEDFDQVILALFGPQERRRSRRLLGDDEDDPVPYYQAIINETFMELTETERAALNTVFSLGFQRNFILGEGLLELARADCILGNAMAAVAADMAVEDFRALLSILGLSEEEPLPTTTSIVSDSSESSESDESSESVDDARNVNEGKDDLDLDLDKMSEGNEDGSEVVILRIATSTMTNIWIGLIVFCCFNLSLFWFILVRKRKKSVYYETADERPSISVNY